jgi:hypothetical protein
MAENLQVCGGRGRRWSDQKIKTKKRKVRASGASLHRGCLLK